ncbi:MAG: flagellar biosynthesis protein FlgJ, partial [Gammaproteobacteria bacterium]|nr:flagellar biosynthesis protein FlgJ [Gammaproteobacteria bacterium]
MPFALAYSPKAKHTNFLDYRAGSERKLAFIAFLKPIIEKKNRSVLDDRRKLIRLSKKSKLNIREQRWLRHIAQRYNSKNFNAHDETHWFALLNKIDLIPASLALAQAAKESGWGTSR